jgi:hypothetical protein
MLINQKKGGRYLAVPKKNRNFAAFYGIKPAKIENKLWRKRL